MNFKAVIHIWNFLPKIPLLRITPFTDKIIKNLFNHFYFKN